MIDSKPLVSICIPTYNSSLYISKTLESIASQTYSNIEVIICDNASTDSTLDIVNEFATKYAITVNINEINIGAIANFNKLLSLARGEYIAIYHSDDVYHQSIVEESVNAFSMDTNIGMVSTMGRLIDDKGNHIHDLVLTRDLKLQNKMVYTFDDAMLGIVNNRRHSFLFISSTVMVKRDVYESLGGFDVKYKSACDYEMWLRISRQHNFANIDKNLVDYRMHSQQGTELEIRKNNDVQDIYYVLNDYKKYDKTRKVLRLCNK